MKLSSVAFKNILSFRDATVEFPKPIAVLFGHNEVGKSSLCHGIELLLTGTCHVLDGTLRVSNLVNLDADAGFVLGHIERGEGKKPTTVQRKLTAKGVATTVNGHEAPKYIYDFFLPALPADPWLLLSVVCNVSGFFGLDPDKQQALLEDLIEHSVPAEALAGLPIGRLKAPPKTLDDLELAYKDAYDRRTGVNRALKALGAFPALVTDLPDLGAIREKISSLRGEEARLVAEIGETAGRRRELEGQVKALADELGRQEVRLQELGDPGEANLRLAQAKDGLAAGQRTEEHNATGRAEVRSLSQMREALAAMDNRLAGLGKACVISDEILCPLESKERDRIRQVWGGRMATLDQTIQDKQRDLKAAPNLVKLHERVRDGERLVSDIEQARAKLKNLEEGIARLQKELEVLPNSTSDREVQVAQLRSRIAKGQENLSAAERLHWEQERGREAREKHEALTAEAADLDILVKALGPGGIRQKLLTERVTDLMAKVNDITKSFGVLVEFPLRINGVPPALAAESARFRAGLAFQVALAQLSGIRFVLVDGLDVLDREHRTIAVNLLLGAVRGGLIDQAILTATIVNEAALQANWPPEFSVATIERDATRGSFIQAVA